jgi:ABC-type glycerol-3-phosphate transport system substrate-binding protein
MLKGRRLLLATVGAAAAAWTMAGGVPAAQAAESLTVCHGGHPIMVASQKILDKWAKKEGASLSTTLIAYDVYVPKVTQMLTTNSPQCDIIWHNDDWGQLWKQYLITTNDIPGMETTAKQPLEAFFNDDHKYTAVPMAHTMGTFFYRKDLIAPNEVPKTLDDMVKLGEKLQKEGKVKWGYVGAMAFNHTWISQWWTVWNSGCDIFKPVYSRDNKVLTENGWTPLIDQPCHKKIVEFWWDNLHKNKISPESMTSYGRNEANAIFMAGDAAITVADSTFWGDYNDKNKSKVAGKVGMAPFPVGQDRKKPISWIDIWGWAIPKSVSPAHQALAKKLLGEMLNDTEGQVEMWNATGGPPPNTKVWDILAAKDPVFQQLKAADFDQEHVHSAYYFPNWPKVHKAYSDVVIKALTGKREDIGSVLTAGVKTVHDAAVSK